MLALAFFKWWYGPGWLQAGTSLKKQLRHTYYGYSVPQLSRTLFAPWRRIISTAGGSLGDRARAMIDNGLSRVIGAIVRLITLGAAALIALAITIFGLVRFVMWPILPLAGPILIIWGIL